MTRVDCVVTNDLKSAMDIRICAVKLWLLRLTVLTLLRPCSSMELPVLDEEIRTPSAAEHAQPASDNGVSNRYRPVEYINIRSREYQSRKYFYVHNETQIAMARAEAGAQYNDGVGETKGSSSILSSILGFGAFPDFQPSKDGCSFRRAVRDLSYHGPENGGRFLNLDISILAVDSCAGRRDVSIGYDYLEFCSQRWVKPEKLDILIRDNPDPLTRSFKVLVKIFGTEDPEILGDGVYFPATGKMHLVGCTRWKRLPDFESDSVSTPARMQDFAASRAEMMNVSDTPAPAELWYARWTDPDSYHEPPLNSSTPEDCAISATVQYPPLNCRWNTDRILKYSVRSKREKDDPLYFEPVERSAFFTYLHRDILLQRRLETGARILLLVLGLVCLALQIEHGRNNEEALPFVSLVMLGMQLANHLSQLSIFKDLQVGQYFGDYYNGIGQVYPANGFHFGDSVSEYNYYETLAWSEHVPYQAMAMAAIFMYVWMFHKVGDRRRIMKLRVLRKRAGAKDPPSDWRVMYATIAIFLLLCFLGFFVIGADRYGHIRRALTEEPEKGHRSWRELPMDGLGAALAPFGELEEQMVSPFLSRRFYELSEAQWGFVNNLTGLAVSLFLVPQLLGNIQWQFHGRPLSAWFYVGIPFLQSLPHFVSIAKYFQLLPIIPFYDPYFNSIYGIYENPTPWWQFGVVLCSVLQVLVVHSQFSRSLIHGPQHSISNTRHVQSCDLL